MLHKRRGTRMYILAVDDERLMLDALTESIHKAAPEDTVFSFRKSSEALEFAKTHPIDVAFLDIRMRGMDGLELGKALLQLFPAINLIYCTSFDEYISDAFRQIRCNGYITKPVDAQMIKVELEHLRKPLKIAEKKANRVSVHCLGRFEVFVEGKVMVFKKAKTKELLAYLVNARGGICTNQEIIAALWEDDGDHYSYLKKLKNDLISSLEEKECSDILVQVWGGIGVDMDKIDSDYTEWKRLHNGQRPQEYMSQYLWSRDFDWE